MMGDRSVCMLVWFLISLLCSGPGAEAARQQRTIVSPEVRADRRVTFRLHAPGARSVLLEGMSLPQARPMGKNSEGLWSITVGPVEPDIHEYNFVVDDLKVPDPLNPDVKVWRRVSRSMVLVPGEEPLFFEEQAVPRGTVHVHKYQSKSLNVVRGLYVYTPPGYETREGTTYPVLYLLHGSGDTELTWTVVGRAHVILDNAIAQKRARPMIVVMPYGHTPGAASDRSRTRRHEAFKADLIADVIPFVRANYRVSEGPEYRALAGLSMGGGQALRIGLGHSELFAWVGAFSSAIPSEEELRILLAAPDSMNANLKLLWVGCGKEDFLFKANQGLLEQLKAKGIKHLARITDGGHEWRVWRRYLNELLPLLFDKSG